MSDGVDMEDILDRYGWTEDTEFTIGSVFDTLTALTRKSMFERWPEAYCGPAIVEVTDHGDHVDWVEVVPDRTDRRKPRPEAPDYHLQHRDITNATNERTSILSIDPQTATAQTASVITPLLPNDWQLVTRDITRSTDERTSLSSVVPGNASGHTAGMLTPLSDVVDEVEDEPEPEPPLTLF